LTLSIVLPFHDPAARLLPHLAHITPDLKSIFAHAFVSLSPATLENQSAALRPLRADPFFQIIHNAPGTGPGDHYRAAYALACANVPPDEILHLCNIDMVAFALGSEHCPAFLSSLESTRALTAPLLFERSAAALATYPAVYREFEHVALRAGLLLFNRSLDWAWSHLALPAGHLAAVLPNLTRSDFGILPELLLHLLPTLRTQSVDWLAWEDPFIERRNPAALRADRDADPAETRKRLTGLIALLDVLTHHPLSNR
jgi:hypothetical protein